MNIQEMRARLEEIRNILSGNLEGVDVDAITNEVNELRTQIAEAETRANQARELRDSIANGNVGGMIATPVTPASEPTATVETRNTTEYMEAYARGIVSGDFSECRALLSVNANDGVTITNGQVEVPDYVEQRIRTAWENDEFMRHVSRSFLPGNLKIGFEVSGTEAVIHAEGTEAPTEETLVLGYVTLIPGSIKKWIRISDEVMDLTGQAFIDYVYDELAYRIVKKAVAIAIAAILALPATSSQTEPAVASITEELGSTTIINAEAELTAEVGQVFAIMNRKTRAALKAIQIASGNNVGDVFDGLDVVYTDALPAYADAAEGAAYMIVGDIADGIRANFPNGDEIKFKFDDLSEAEADLVKVVGRMYAAIGVVAPLRFCKVLKPEE